MMLFEGDPTQLSGGTADAARETPLRSYDLFIGGKDVPGDGWVYTTSAASLLEDVFTSISLKRALEKDPDDAASRHRYVVGRCAVATTAHIDESLQAAAEAAKEWARVPLERRLRLGELFRETLLANQDEFLELLVAESHPVKLARWELSCLYQLYGRESVEWYAEQMHKEFNHGNRRLIVRRQPDGVVCFNPPQNAAGPSAALAVLPLMAGNAVVVRAPRSIPLSTMYLCRELIAPLLEEVGAPPGVLNALCSNPKQTTDRWVESPLVDDIFFVGGSEEGLKLQERCIANGKKPILELAGNDSIVVWKDADLDAATEAILECFYGSGQICMVPNCVVVHPEVADELIARIKAQIVDVKPGYPDQEDVLLSPVRRAEKFFALQRQAIERGAELISGGGRMEVDGTPSETGVFLQPTVLRVNGLDTSREMDMVKHETFFPLLPVIVPDASTDPELLDAFIEFVNTNDYGLRNSLWARSDEVIDQFVQRIVNGGLLKVNDSHIGFLPYLPSHGGTGLTGGVYGEANYPMLKTSHVQGVSVATGIRPRQAVFDGA
ncbi:Succinate-semialdehyde dehydrogenase [NADP(+)] [Actinokineospora sp. UTMC 2448]|nr:Succinate-semialdehyde dehydrogenase [NADP(+)] [Actinokineospora sp. UTMC 2448]